MRKKIRLLTLLTLSSSLLFSCNQQVSSVELKLVDKYHGEYEVGSVIDTDNFFYCSSLGAETITVSYVSEGETITESVVGHTYYPAYPVTYTFVCSAGGKSISKTVDVTDSVPTLNVSTFPYVARQNETVGFKDLMSEMQVQYSPKTASLAVSDVEYRTVTYDVGGETGEWTSVQYDKDSFVASSLGEYRVKLTVTNGEKSVDNYLSVAVAKSLNDGTDYVLKDENGQYCSNHLITGDKADVFTLPAASYSQSSYAVINHEFAVGEELEIQFKGKKLPLIGMYLSPNPLSYNPYDLYSADGYLLTWEVSGTNRYVLYGPKCLQSKGQKIAVESRGEYWGYQDLDEDTYYAVKCSISGNTLGTNGLYTHFVSWSVYEIENYGEENQHYGALVKELLASGWQDEHSLSKAYFGLYSSKYASCTCKVLYGPKEVEENVFVSKGIETGTRTYRFSPASYSGNATVGYSADSGYLAFKGDYGAGTSVTYKFTGKNIPNVCLFADQLSTMTDGEGMYLSSGTKDANLLMRMTVYGPHRLDSGNPDDYEGYTAIGYNGRLYTETNSPFGYSNLEDNKTYIYKIVIDSTTDHNVSLSLYLFDYVSDTEYTQLAKLSLTVKNYAGDVSGNIIAYSQFMGSSTEFSYYPVNDNTFKVSG